MSCAPVPHVLLVPKRKQKLPRRRQTARSLLTGTYYGKSDNTICVRVLTPSLPGKNHCRSSIKELLLDFDYDSGPDGGITVYTYDPNAPTLVHEIGGFFTFSRFYDNGIVEEDISHGSPYGGPYSTAGAADPNTFWPYQVWSYQADDASYTQIGFVTDWNKKEWADSIDGFSSFPDSADKDHDGIVYLLTNAKGKETAIDAADLKKWVDSYRKGAKEIPITYQRLK